MLFLHEAVERCDGMAAKRPCLLVVEPGVATVLRGW